jgi:hypothetical protein
MNRVSIKLFNLHQLMRQELEQRLLLDQGEPICGRGEPCWTFECETCNQLMPWGRAAGDNHPEICNSYTCWAIGLSKDVHPP